MGNAICLHVFLSSGVAILSHIQVKVRKKKEISCFENN